jgi:hypothetical protein
LDVAARHIAAERVVDQGPSTRAAKCRRFRRPSLMFASNRAR